MTVRVLNTDALSGLAQLEDESVHCVVTSPPYWGLRSYGGDPGMIGLEPTFEEHLENLVAVFREVRRVLRLDGTVWMNYGDSYVSGQGGRQYAVGELPPVHRHDRPTPKERDDVDVAAWSTRAVAPRHYPPASSGWKPKDLMLMPARVAIALQEDGWWVRRDIIWHKPNPMPESATDRPTTAHEYIYLLTKAARYFYDAEATKEAVTGNAHPRRSYKEPDGWDTTTGQGGHGSIHRRGRDKGRKPGVSPKSAPAGSGIKANESMHAAGGRCNSRSRRKPNPGPSCRKCCCACCGQMSSVSAASR